MGQLNTGISLLAETMATSTSIDSRAKIVTSQPLANPDKVSCHFTLRLVQ
jgi:hypothetical protein